MINNRITDLICRIRNSLLNNRDGFIISNKAIEKSKESIELLSKLGSMGIITYNPELGSWYLRNYPESNKFILGDIYAISTSGRRIYRQWSDIREGELVRSSSGFLTWEEAWKERKGGELILKYEKKGIIEKMIECL